jgi:hypothetical protein
MLPLVTLKLTSFTYAPVDAVELESECIEMSKWLKSISECGNDWKRHITYIMMDFLSGTDVFTSE